MYPTEKNRLNNFDFVRLLAASMVVYAHSFDLLVPAELVGQNSEPLRVLTNGNMSFGSLGVGIFFCLSGYLITQSLDNSRNYTSYFTKRFLRIFPALILDLVIAVFIFGPLVTSLPILDYFSNPNTYLYLTNVFLFKLTFFLPGVFETNVNSPIVNGSLWTLPYEFLCYLGVVVLNILLISKSRKFYAFVGVIFFGLSVFILNSSFSTFRFGETDITLENICVLVPYFGAGVLFYRFRDKIKFNWILSLILLVVYCLSFSFGKSSVFGYLCLPYIIFWFVFSPKIKLHWVSKWGDFSYGMYIYSFSVQQTIVHFLGNRMPVGKMIFLSFLFTIPLAMFSWFVIEKRALKLKDSLVKPLNFENKVEAVEFA